MDGKAKGSSSEIHVTEIFGIPLFRKYVEVGSAGQVKSALHSAVSCRFKISMIIISLFISLLVPVTASLCLLYYPPPVFRELRDSFFKIYSPKSNVEELQKIGIVCEAEKRTLNATLRDVLSGYDKLMADSKKDKEDSSKMENELHNSKDYIDMLREQIARLEKREEMLQARENRFIQKLTSVNEKEFAVKQEFLAANETIKKLEEKEGKLEKILSDQEILNLELEKNLTNSKNETNEITKKLSAATQKIHKMEEVSKVEKQNLAVSERNLLETKGKVATLEENVKDFKEKFNDVTEQKSTITKKYKDTESRLVAELKQVKKDSKKLEGKVNYLKNNIKNVTEEKLDMEKRIDVTEVMLGDCKNKNMDQEIEKSELVKKLLKAEKELKNCH